MTAFATLLADPAAVLPCGNAQLRDLTHDSARALENFLSAVECKAFRIAQIALRHEADALDVVQDAMLQLSVRYASRPPEQWRPLFYRILENRIRDVHRRRAVRSRVMAWISPSNGEQASADALAEVPAPDPLPGARAEGQQAMAALEAALAQLPGRQKQAFLLRTLEGLDVAGTAAAMGCSEGSVKTHYFRAVRRLRERLGEFWR